MNRPNKITFVLNFKRIQEYKVIQAYGNERN